MLCGTLFSSPYSPQSTQRHTSRILDTHARGVLAERQLHRAPRVSSVWQSCSTDTKFQQPARKNGIACAARADWADGSMQNERDRHAALTVTDVATLVVAAAARQLDAIGVVYSLLGRAAAAVQGVEVEMITAEVAVQWDLMSAVHTAFQAGSPWRSSELFQAGSSCWFRSRHQGGGPVLLIWCQKGAFVAADPYRVKVQITDPRRRSEQQPSPPPRSADPRIRREQAKREQANTEAVQQPGRPPGVMDVWARSLCAVQRQALGLPSSASVVGVLPAEAWHSAPGSSSSGSSCGSTSSTQPPDAILAAAVSNHLQQLQAKLSTSNGAAWAGEDTYQAWCTRFGPPAEAAGRIRLDPASKLGPLLDHLHQLVQARQQQQEKEEGKGPIPGHGSALQGSHGSMHQHEKELESTSGSDQTATKRTTKSASAASPAGASSNKNSDTIRVANLMGSHGSKAVAMALCLGIQPTVVDISEGNARYAREMAAEAGVALDYVVGDILGLPSGPAAPGGPLHEAFDGVVMEMGILHYFVDLRPLMALVAMLLKPGGGRLLLRDFHPVSTKLVTSKGKKHKAEGDYFDQGLAQVDVAYSKFSPEESAQQVMLRRWTLGEVVTAVAESGLTVLMLEEEQGVKGDDKGLPKAFTLVARRP